MAGFIALGVLIGFVIGILMGSKIEVDRFKEQTECAHRHKRCMDCYKELGTEKDSL